MAFSVCVQVSSELSAPESDSVVPVVEDGVEEAFALNRSPFAEEPYK